MDKFFPPSFENEIFVKVLNVVFPSLNVEDKKFLNLMLVGIINFIALKFNFDNDNVKLYEDQFRNNKYRDIRKLINTILPNIDDTGGMKKKKLKSFENLYLEKKDGDNEKDLNNHLPSYEFTSLQYSRCQRDEKGDFYKEKEYNPNHLVQNYLLFLKTIDRISNKLIVNWFNLRPISPIYDHFVNTDFYKKTYESIINGEMVSFKINNLEQYKNKLESVDSMSNLKKINNDSFNLISVETSRGLSIDYIYDVIHNYFFTPIVNIKWMIYDHYSKTSDEMECYLIKLHKIIGFNNCLNDLEYDNLEQIDKNEFKNNFSSLMGSFSEAILGENKDDGSDITLMLCRTLMFFFDKYYSHKISNEDKVGYVQLIDDKKSEIPDETSEVLLINSKENDEKIKNNMIIIDAKYIYDYVKICLNKFKKTWYSLFLIESTNEDVKYKFKTNDFYRVHGCTLKNYYNLSKSLIHKFNDKKGREKDKELRLDKFFDLLTEDDANRIIEKLNSNFSKWINIGGYIRKIYNLSNIRDKSEQLSNNIKNNLTSCLFYCLSFYGLIVEFTPENKLTNRELYPSNKTTWPTIRKMLMESITMSGKLEYYKKSHSFLVNEPFESLNSMNGQNCDEKIDYIHWIFNNSGSWFDFYALDWMEQITFYHKFMNNRAMLISGGTGVGKSTEVPKLFVFALKMINFKLNGKVAVSVPRTGPAIGVPKYSSNNMGLPITCFKKVDDYKMEIETNNYQFQFTSKAEKHERNNDDIMIKFFTDKSLYLKIKDSVLLKKLSHRVDNEDNNYNLFQDEIMFTKNNMYDVVIVDESHEHNINMDMILTLMKYGSYFNNDIKVVILTATMGRDEGVYRRYYRDINDNKIYPCSTFLEKYKLDRINVDRRFDLSEPDKLTKHTIVEKFRKKISRDTIYEVKMILKEILKTSKNGHILIFIPTKNSILEYLKMLNDYLPEDVIGFPLYGDLTNDQKKFVEKLDSYISNYQYSRNELFPDEPFKPANPPRVKKGTYKRGVVLATNIAEASITIDGLSFVIDLGTQNIAYYDYEVNDVVMHQTLITDESRQQRRGRVGRTAEGTVYYLYEKKDIEKVVKYYSISIIDISSNIYELLRKKENKKPLFNIENDPNFNDVKKNFNPKIQEESGVNRYNGIYNILKDQYYSSSEKYLKYYGNNEDYDYENNQMPHLYYDGFSRMSMYDKDGTFYLIHPEESLINRNIVGKIINLREKNNDAIKLQKLGDDMIMESKKMDLFFNMMEDKKLIKNNFQTEYGNYMEKILSKEIFLFENVDYISSYFYSRMLKCDDEILKILSYYYSTSISLRRLIVKNKNPKTRYDEVKKFKNMIHKKNSDSVNILGLINSLMEIIYKYIINNKCGNCKRIDKFFIIRKKIEFFKLYNDNDETIILNSSEFNNDKDILGKLIKLHKSENLTNKETLTDIETKYLITNNSSFLGLLLTFDKDLIYNKLIIDWCKTKYLLPELIFSFLNNYFKNLKNVKNYEDEQCDENMCININMDEMTDENEIKNKENIIDGSLFKLIDKELKKNNDELFNYSIYRNLDDRIKICLLMSKPYNLMRKMENNKFIAVYNPNPNNLNSIGMISNGIVDTTLKHTSSYITCWLKNNYKIFGIENVDILMIKNCLGFIYNKKLLESKKYNKQEIIKKSSKLLSKKKISGEDVNKFLIHSDKVIFELS